MDLSERTLDISTLGSRGGLPTVVRVAWERSAPGYRHAPGAWPRHQITVQITLRGMGRCWPEGDGLGIDLPPGYALMYDNRIHPRLVYGRAEADDAYDFLYVNLAGESATASIRDLAAFHRHVVPLGVEHPLLRECMTFVRSVRSAHEAWPWERSTALAQRVLLSLIGDSIVMRAPPVDRLVSQAMALLSAEESDVTAVARMLGVSREHLGRVFRERVGEPPARWRRRLWLDRAARRILAGEPIAVAARACGFSNAAHFAALFRAHVGMSPSHFRRRGHELQQGAVETPERGLMTSNSR